jgi:hypothetical protein
VVPSRLGPQRAAPPRRLIAAAAVAAAVLAGCGGSSGRVQSRHSPVSTTAPAASSTTGGPSVTVGIICIAPTDAAQALLSAWATGDQAAAGRCASPAAVSALFGHASRGTGWTFQGCGGPDPGVPQCTYASAGGHASLTLMGSEASGWKVDSLSFGP